MQNISNCQICSKCKSDYHLFITSGSTLTPTCIADGITNCESYDLDGKCIYCKNNNYPSSTGAECKLCNMTLELEGLNENCEVDMSFYHKYKASQDKEILYVKTMKAYYKYKKLYFNGLKQKN